MHSIIFDIIILIVLVYSALDGLRNGLVKSLFKFGSWIIALVGSYFLLPVSKDFLQSNTNVYGSIDFSTLPDPFSQLNANMVFTFLCFLIGVLIIKAIMSIIMAMIPSDGSLLGSLNRAGGLVVGIVKGLILASLIVIAILPITSLIDPQAAPIVTRALDESVLGGFLARHNLIMIILNAIF